ncbi:MAG: hypothetical protein NT162_01895, partial [Candidatus Woesebacteria bacterium]|nr:hypothetical protein [Candidatus Woesebacteria bacterium]
NTNENRKPLPTGFLPIEVKYRALALLTGYSTRQLRTTALLIWETLQESLQRIEFFSNPLQIFSHHTYLIHPMFHPLKHLI